MRLRIAVSVIAFYILASAAAASAECAWLLWITKLIKGENAPSILRGGAYESATKCMAETRANVDSLVRPNIGVADLKEYGNGFHFVIADDKTFLLESYECLPDTVDPRGTKGGER